MAHRAEYIMHFFGTILGDNLLGAIWNNYGWCYLEQAAFRERLRVCDLLTLCIDLTFRQGQES